MHQVACLVGIATAPLDAAIRFYRSENEGYGPVLLTPTA